MKEDVYPNSKFKRKHLWFQCITESTKKPGKLLNKFNKCEKGWIKIFISCKTINEGADTKWANMLVNIGPSESYIVEI